jgi:hypothetical protein
MKLVSVSGSPESRQRDSVFRKVAVGAAIVGALAATAGVATVLILAGSVELGSVISYACWLGSVGVLATGRRWAPMVSATLSAVILGLLANQPYATGSLLNPRGNYGHFAGVVVILCCALLVFGGSLAAAVRSYR